MKLISSTRIDEDAQFSPDGRKDRFYFNSHWKQRNLGLQ